MTVSVITYDEESGRIINGRTIMDDDYTTGQNELILNDREVDIGLVFRGGYIVDTSTDPPTLIDNPNHYQQKELMQEYENAKNDLEVARQEYNDARDRASNAANREERINAIQDQIDAIAKFLDQGVVPAIDTLFKEVMEEAPDD